MPNPDPREEKRNRKKKTLWAEDKRLNKTKPKKKL